MDPVSITIFPPRANIDPHLDSRVKRGREHTTVTVSASKMRTTVQRVELGCLSVGGRVVPKSATAYKVRLTNADYDRLKARQLAVPNPYRPETIPHGARVLLGATLVERLGDGLVRVTSGPLHAARKMFGRGSPTQGGRLRFECVELELAAGRAAFDRLLKDGQFPLPHAPGVVARKVMMCRRTGRTTAIEETDVATGLTTLRLHTVEALSSLKWERTVSSDGKTVPGTERFVLEPDRYDAKQREALYQAFTGASAPPSLDERVLSLSFTPEQIRALQRQLGGSSEPALERFSRYVDPAVAARCLLGEVPPRLLHTAWADTPVPRRPLPGCVSLG